MRCFSKKVISAVLFLMWGVAAAAMSYASAEAQDTSTKQQPTDKETRELVEVVCASCHDLTVVTERTGTKDEWKAVVQSMVARGADLSEKEADLVTDYLARQYPPKPK